MKVKPIVLAAAIACVMALVGGSIAYNTITGTARNTVSASNVKIELSVLQDNGQGSRSVVSGSTLIMPGETVSRIVQVNNIGKEAAWVRVSATIAINGDTTPAADNPYVVFENLNSTDWEWSNGYWYYTKPLEPGKTTESLFDAVTCNTGIDSGYSDAELQLDIQADATQTQYNGSKATEAQGW